MSDTTMTPIEKAEGGAAEDTAAMRARALEARQGINEIIFAALKMKGRNLHTRSRSLPLTIIGGFLGSGKTTMLMIKAHDGNGEAVAQAHIKRRCVEEAQETIPGFLHGETMLSAEDPGLVCVMCTWEDEAAYNEWQKSPVRSKQVEDLTKVISADFETYSYRSIHTVAKR